MNIIDGADERDSILAIGPALGLTPAEIARIRHVSGHVGCFLPSPSVGTGALFLTNRQIITAGHILFDPSGSPRSKCFFQNPGSRADHDRPRARRGEHAVRSDAAARRLEPGLRHRAPGRAGAGRRAVSGRRDAIRSSRRQPDRHHGASGRHGARGRCGHPGRPGLHGAARADIVERDVVLPHRLRRDRLVVRRHASRARRRPSWSFAASPSRPAHGATRAFAARPTTSAAAASPRRSAPTPRSSQPEKALPANDRSRVPSVRLFSNSISTWRRRPIARSIGPPEP